MKLRLQPFDWLLIAILCVPLLYLSVACTIFNCHLLSPIVPNLSVISVLFWSLIFINPPICYQFMRICIHNNSFLSAPELKFLFMYYLSNISIFVIFLSL